MPEHRLHALSTPPDLFLAPGEGVEEDEKPRLAEEEQRHAKVLRLREGMSCFGLDGEGGRMPLRVTAVRGGRIEVEQAGPPLREPAPGAEHCSMPWIELVIAWPKKQRAEPMIGSLVQLGVAAITPLIAEQRGPEPCPTAPPERWLRIARTALKQSGRTWLPRFESPLTPEDIPLMRPDATLAMLAPRASLPFDTWLRSLRVSAVGVGSRARPIVLILGPEGGLTTRERDGLLRAGSSPVWLGPHIMRIETAALAAMAVAGNVLGTVPDRGH